MIVHLVYENRASMEGEGPFRLVEAFLYETHARKWIEAQPDPWGREDREWIMIDPLTMGYGHMRYEEIVVRQDDITRCEEEARDAALHVLANLPAEQRQEVASYFGATPQ